MLADIAFKVALQPELTVHFDLKGLRLCQVFHCSLCLFEKTSPSLFSQGHNTK